MQRLFQQFNNGVPNLLSVFDSQQQQQQLPKKIPQNGVGFMLPGNRKQSLGLLDGLLPVENFYTNKTTQNKEMKSSSFS
jgi:hypothetical protein